MKLKIQENEKFIHEQNSKRKTPLPLPPPPPPPPKKKKKKKERENSPESQKVISGSALTKPVRINEMLHYLSHEHHRYTDFTVISTISRHDNCIIISMNAICAWWHRYLLLHLSSLFFKYSRSSILILPGIYHRPLGVSKAYCTRHSMRQLVELRSFLYGPLLPFCSLGSLS